MIDLTRQVLRCLLLLSLLWQFEARTTWAEVVRVPTASEAHLRSALREVEQRRAAGDAQPLTVELAGGTYRLTETIEINGQMVGNGLTLQPASPEKPATPEKVVLSGAIPLECVGKDEAGRFRYSLPNTIDLAVPPRQLLIESQVQAAARHPNVGFFRIDQSLPDRRSGFRFNPRDLPDSLDIAGKVCDLVFLHDWSSSRLPVQTIDIRANELRTVGPIGCSAPHYAIDHFEKQPRYYLEGHPAFADIPGEWYLDLFAKQVVVIAAGSESSPPAVALPLLETLLTAKGTEDQPLSHLRILGITFSGTKFPMPPGGLAGAQATMHEPRSANGSRASGNRPMLSAAVHLEMAHHSVFSKCQFEFLGNSGLWLGGRTTHCRIEACRFADIGGNAINLGENNDRQVGGKVWFQAAPEQVPTANQVAECQISRCGRMLPGAVAIWGALHRDLEITNNKLDDCPYTGISLGWMWNPNPTPAGGNRIVGNHIQRMMQVLSDGGGIYTLGAQPGSLIEKNVIHDIPLNAGRAESNGMFLDEGSTGWTISDNTLRRIAKSPLRFHKAGVNTVQRNQWDLATEQTPPIRFNATPERVITSVDNTVLPPQRSIFMIGNSLTWDTVPAKLSENVRWHIDCGKPLPYIHERPQKPCVESSWLWPSALAHHQYDLVTVQPHYGSTLESDVAAIEAWVTLQPKAKFVIHTGWARHESFREEFAATSAEGAMQHSPAYFHQLLFALRERFPDRQFEMTQAMRRLALIAADIEANRSPFKSLAELYRDAIHMSHSAGRYLMHNTMRQALEQEISNEGFPDLDPEVKKYLDELLMR